MKKIMFLTTACALLSGFLYIYPDYARTYSEIIRLNTASTKAGVPKNFRFTSINTSGSAQFSSEELSNIVNKINKESVMIVDLREEPHGFLNGIPISWYKKKNWLNKGKSLDEILLDEEKRLNNLSKKFIAILYEKKTRFPHLFAVKTVEKAENVSHKYGLQYIRFPVSDATRPSDEIVNEFVAFVNGLDNKIWLHFHCSAGRGRTTTFLTMHAIMKEAQSRSLEDIVEEQCALGGVNLLADPDPNYWKYPYTLERKEFIKNFYKYCREAPDFNINWTDWSKQNS